MLFVLFVAKKLAFIGDAIEILKVVFEAFNADVFKARFLQLACLFFAPHYSQSITAEESRTIKKIKFEL
jgi:hypothetical protein